LEIGSGEEGSGAKDELAWVMLPILSVPLDAIVVLGIESAVFTLEVGKLSLVGPKVGAVYKQLPQR
jgi:hypothetical protein